VDIESWLRALNLAQHAEAFVSNGVDAALLPTLSNEDLKDLGVARLADRKTILNAITALPSAGSVAAQREDPARPRGAADRRQLTVLFADLVGSTALSSTLDPEDMREVLRAYQNAVAGEISRFEGHVAKFMGDGVLAYFGFPRAHEDAAERAVRAGLAVVDSVAALAAPTGEGLAVRIGIATGLVVVGDLIGEGAAQEEAVVGDTPNLAARLEAIADPNAIVVSETTQRLLGDLFELQALGARPLKGFARPHHAWRVLGERVAISRFEALRAGVLTPFTGREREMGLLLDCWGQAKAGEGQVVLLSGEAGIGKSRMIGTLLETLAAEPHVPMRYQCSPHHVSSALYPVSRQLERDAGIAADEPPAIKRAKLVKLLRGAGEDIAQAAPLIASVLSISGNDDQPTAKSDRDQQKRQTLAALVGQILCLAERQPVLMVAEDVHWADPTTLDFLEYVLSRIGEAAVFVVLTCRPEFEPSWGGYSHVTKLALNRLTRRQSESIVRALAGDKHLPAEVLDQIVTRTDGMPLFVEELTKDVLESKLLREVDDHYELAGSLSPVAIPSSLQDSLMARLDRLGTAKDLAQIGAAIGREFSHPLLATVSGWSGNELEQALAQLISAQLVFKRGSVPNATYVFKHALIQDVAHTSLLKRRRRDLHHKIAQALEAQRGTDEASEPEVLAYHYGEADVPERAIHYWWRASKTARRRSNYLEALRHLTQAVALVSKLPPGQADTSELDLQMAIGETYRATKGTGSLETGQAFDRARVLCEALGERDRKFHVVYGQFICNFNRPNLGKAQAHASEFVQLAAESKDLEAAIIADHMIGTTIFLLGDLVAARARLEHGLSHDDVDQERINHYAQGNFPSGTLMYLAWSLFALGYPDQARQRCAEAIKASKETSGFIYAMSLSNACAIDHFLRDVDSIKRHATAALTIAEEKGIFIYSQYPRIYLGWAKLRTGDHTGLPQMQDAVTKARSSGQEVEVPHDLALLAEGYSSMGDVKTALQYVDEALAIVDRTDERWYAAEIHSLRARLLLDGGNQVAEAERHYHHALEIARAQKAGMWELRAATGLARVWRDQGKITAARDILAPVHGWFTEGLDLPDIVDAGALLQELSS
jgi:class 3 adenylate cyclase/tetratricopeptide (TPR) repeat protein